MDVFDLFAAITLDTSGYENSLDEASNTTESFGSKLKSGLAAAAKVGAAAISAAATGIAALTKASISSYADYEQLVGGVDTLFADASSTVQESAANAYKTAGLSANDYMTTVTSFSAALLQGLGGDTAAAADMADMAITDMADNANKMGSDMASIQDAYQGFAKQNYTMLDNLKLGYGGTASEMARLVNDSGVLGEEITVTSDTINSVSYDQIIDAIHVVQTEMGITGTTAKEASTTISGSVASMKSAWTNWTTALAGGGDLNATTQALIDSVLTVKDNIIPVIEQILPNITEGLGQLMEAVANELPGILSIVLPTLTDSAASMVLSLVDGLISYLPELIPVAMSAAETLASGLLDMLPTITQSAVDIIIALANGLTNMLPTLIPAAIAAIVQLSNTLTSPDNLTMLINAALDIIMALADGLIASLPTLIEQAPIIVANLVSAIVENIPAIIDTGFDLIEGLVTGLINAIPDLWTSALDIGKNIVSGVWQGIQNSWYTFWSNVSGFFSGIVSSVKNVLGIASPSKVFAEIGGYMAAGIGVGFDDQIDAVKSDINSQLDFGEATIGINATGTAATSSGSSMSGIGTVNITVNGANYKTEKSLAEAISVKLQELVTRKEAVWA